MKNPGWEQIEDEKTAANFILRTENYQGYFRADEEMLNALIPHDQEAPDGKPAILDMCCGIGRNTIWISKNRPEYSVWGYDLKNMIGFAKVYAERHLGDSHGINLTDDFSVIEGLELDICVCTICFQHIYPEHLDIYYAALAKCLARKNGVICVSGRDWCDFNNHEFVWERLQRYFDLDAGHVLSSGFQDAVFTPFPDKGHHMGVFRPKNASRAV
jgi:SAM-dependent methyltransferase